jgi:hypothetical protein
MKPLDLIVTPLAFFLIMALAYLLRKTTASNETKRYFYPALLLKIVGALGVGFIYQFYYGGGDTFTFFTHGASHVFDAFVDDIGTGFKLLTSNGEFDPETYKYSSKIWTYRDASSFFVVRIASILSLISFNAYSSVALWFAFLSFWGLWLMYQAFYRIYPELNKQFAIAIFFIPTVFFWGSGILKDTLTLGATGFLVYAFIQIFFERRRIVLNILLALIMAYVIFNIKLYILLSIAPALIVWFFVYRVGRISQVALRILLAPVFIGLGVLIAFLLAREVGETSDRYRLDKIAETAQVTAYDIRYWTGKDAGSGYSLGELDGTYWSMIKLAPSAVNVSLFRPYLWEVNNPLMLLSALEALALLLLVVYILWKNRFKLVIQSLKSPIILFCLIFSLLFAFGVGISTYNFGTLSRYRIVMIPFFLIALFLIDFHAQVKEENLQQ